MVILPTNKLMIAITCAISKLSINFDENKNVDTGEIDQLMFSRFWFY